jgi:hypothetical protein
MVDDGPIREGSNGTFANALPDGGSIERPRSGPEGGDA